MRHIQTFFKDEASFYFFLILVAVIHFTIHEFSHALSAYMLGDRSVKDDGRLTLNPLKHVDPIGIIILVFFKIGWARPVNVDLRNFKEPKRDLALVSLAGPISNLILSFFSVFAFVLIEKNFGTNIFSQFLRQLGFWGVLLAVFNLLPLPSFDGFKAYSAILPDRLYYTLMGLERFGIIFFIVAINLPFFRKYLYEMTYFLYSDILRIVTLILKV